MWENIRYHRDGYVLVGMVANGLWHQCLGWVVHRHGAVEVDDVCQEGRLIWDDTCGVRGDGVQEFSFDKVDHPRKNGFVEGVVGVVQNLQASEEMNI